MSVSERLWGGRIEKTEGRGGGEEGRREEGGSVRLFARSGPDYFAACCYHS